MPPNSIDNDEDKGKGGWAKGLVDESQNKGKPLEPRKRVWGKGWTDPCQQKKRHDLPAIFRWCISKSSARAIWSSHGSVLDKLANLTVLHLRNKVVNHAFLRVRCHTAFRRSKRNKKGTVERTSFSNVWTMVAEQLDWTVRNEPKTKSSTCFRESSQGSNWWRGITWGWHRRKETIGGTPNGYTFFVYGKKSWRE